MHYCLSVNREVGDVTPERRERERMRKTFKEITSSPTIKHLKITGQKFLRAARGISRDKGHANSFVRPARLDRQAENQAGIEQGRVWRIYWGDIYDR